MRYIFNTHYLHTTATERRYAKLIEGRPDGEYRVKRTHLYIKDGVIYARSGKPSIDLNKQPATWWGPVYPVKEKA